MDMKDLDRIAAHLTQVLGFFPRVDAKAGGLFAFNAAMITVTALNLKAGDLDQVWNGLRRADGIRKIGGDPSRIDRAVRQAGAWHSYLELHIEQGGTLDRARVPIGIVEGIVAIHRYDVEVVGFANHAGTTPMDERQDALQAASRLKAGTAGIPRRSCTRQPTFGKMRSGVVVPTMTRSMSFG